MTAVKVAIVQAEVSPRLSDGLACTERLAAEAAGNGAKLVVFPETWLPGYPVWLDICPDAALWDHAPTKAAYALLAENSVVVDGASGTALSNIAAKNKIVLVVGVSERVEQGKGQGTLYNSLLTYGSDGSLLNHHRKLMPTYTERLVWGQGDAAGIRGVDSKAGKIGGLICWEHWMPAARQTLHDGGEDFHVAVWPTVIETHQIASRHYAFEGRCVVLAAGGLMRASALPPGLEPHPDRVKSQDQWLLRGGSAIIGPDGQYLVQPVFEEERILYAEPDLRRNREESMTLDVTGHYQRPDCFTFEVNRGNRCPEKKRA